MTTCTWSQTQTNSCSSTYPFRKVRAHVCSIVCRGVLELCGFYPDKTQQRLGLDVNLRVTCVCSGTSVDCVVTLSLMASRGTAGTDSHAMPLHASGTHGR